MAEAEEVVTDVARHAAVFARDLWRRGRKGKGAPETLTLADVATRIDLLVTSVFGTSYPIRVAQPPAPPTLLTSVFGRRRGPVQDLPVPATDGVSLWLAGDLGIADRTLALQRYRTMALQQAMRANRGSADALAAQATPLHRDIYLLVEATASDETLVKTLPGIASSINDLRTAALARRPLMSAFPKYLRPLETFVRILLRSDCRQPPDPALRSTSPAASTEAAERIVASLLPVGMAARSAKTNPLLKDWWTGELRSPPPVQPASTDMLGQIDAHDPVLPRAGRLARRPNVRNAADDEDQESREAGAWMVQADEPHEKAEDPMGLQRPTDRDQGSNADELGDMLSELPEARLVSTPGRPKEVLLSEDPPTSRTPYKAAAGDERGAQFAYPEWDYRVQAYRDPGVTVRSLLPQQGPQSWVEDTLDKHRSMLELIRRRFEVLRARRVTLRKQLDGDEIDLDACIDALADLRAGAQMPEGLYLGCRPAMRNMAIMLLIDVSGSTDGWVSSQRRVIDVEREALLLVCIALKEMGEPYAVQAFSGEGPQAVTVQPIKQFDEPFGDEVALRISALEPERYTRAGAAIRHATALLMRQAAEHRLLMLLSDGKPNDVDEYEGRYGVEDMHQAVIEARLQGIFPFCLTIDRQAASYLPRIFGGNQYAMLPEPQLLPTVLLDWMRRLLAARQV